jgi:DNA-binding IclR family transcriptional regulator
MGGHRYTKEEVGKMILTKRNLALINEYKAWKEGGMTYGLSAIASKYGISTARVHAIVNSFKRWGFYNTISL